MTNFYYTEFGYIKYIVPTYTAYDAPVDGRTNYGTCYISEKNSPYTVYRTYYKFNTSSIPSAALVLDAKIQVNLAATYGVVAPGDSILFMINFKTGDNFIGSSITTDDWDGATVSHEKNWGTTWNGGLQWVLLSTNQINKGSGHTTDFELIDNCLFQGHTGHVTFTSLTHNTRGLPIVTLRVTYAYAGTLRFTLLGIQ